VTEEELKDAGISLGHARKFSLKLKEDFPTMFKMKRRKVEEASKSQEWKDKTRFEELEKRHKQYIQVLFRKYSSSGPMTDEDVASFITDPDLKEYISKYSLDFNLAGYAAKKGANHNLKFDKPAPSILTVAKSKDIISIPSPTNTAQKPPQTPAGFKSTQVFSSPPSNSSPSNSGIQKNAVKTSPSTKPQPTKMEIDLSEKNEIVKKFWLEQWDEMTDVTESLHFQMIGIISKPTKE